MNTCPDKKCRLHGIEINRKFCAECGAKLTQVKVKVKDEVCIDDLSDEQLQKYGLTEKDVEGGFDIDKDGNCIIPVIEVCEDDYKMVKFDPDKIAAEIKSMTSDDPKSVLSTIRNIAAKLGQTNVKHKVVFGMKYE